jgi:WD40 repeat protein
MIGMCIYESGSGSAEASPSWENISNITSLTRINDLEVNSAEDSLFILCGTRIEEWGLLEHVKRRTIYPHFKSFGDMDWSDEYRWMAIVNHGSIIDDEGALKSPLAVIDIYGDILFAFTPWGQLPSYNEATIVDLEWGPSSTLLAVLFQDGVLRIYDMETQKLHAEQKFSKNGRAIRWSPSEQLLVVVTEDYRGNEILLYDLDRNESWTVYSGSSTVADLDWSYDSNYLFFLSGSVLLSLQIETMELEPILEQYINAISPSPVETVIALVESRGRITFWNYLTNESDLHIIHQDLTDRSGWTQDGSYFYAEEENTMVVRVWTKESKLPKPSIGIYMPISGTIVSGEIDVSGWASSVYSNNSFVLIKVGMEDWIPAEGFESWYYTLNTTFFPDGELNIRARALDPIGYSDISIVRITVMNEDSPFNRPPQIWIDEPAKNTEVAGIVPIKGGATDDVSVISIQVKVGTLTWKNSPIDKTGSSIQWICYFEAPKEKGDLTIQVRAYDGFSFSETASITVKVVPPNIYPFTVSIYYPTRGSTVLPNFTASGIVGGGTPDAVYLSLDYGIFHKADGTLSWSYSFMGISPGLHWMRAIAVKGPSISQWSSVSFSVDYDAINQRPSVGILQPRPDVVVHENLKVEGWSADDQSIEKVEIRLNGDNWIHATGTNEWNYNFDDSSLEQGWNTIEVRAYDGELYSDNNSTRFYFIPEGFIVGSTSKLLFAIFIILLISTSVLVTYIIKQKYVLRKTSK